MGDRDVRFKTRHWVDDQTGEENSEFECPKCGVWNHLIYYDSMMVIGFKCKKCEFEENANVYPVRKEDGH